MTDCTNNDLQDLLPEFAAGELPARERELVDVHLVSCAACREEYEVIVAVLNARPLPPVINVAAIVAALPKPPVLSSAATEQPSTPALRVVAGGQTGRAPSMQKPARTQRSVFGSSLMKFAATLTLVAVGGMSVIMSNRGLTSSGENNVASASLFSGDSIVVSSLPEPYAPGRVPVKAVVSVAPSVLPIQELSDYSDDELALLLERLDAWDGAPPVEPDNVPPATVPSDSAIQEAS